jgi:hypothetical protein
VTDASGRAEIRGVPAAGNVEIGPDLDPLQRRMIQRDGTGDWRMPAEGWWSQWLKHSKQERVEVTLRVKVPRPGATAFGQVPREMMEGKRVAAKEITDAHPQGGDGFEVAIEPSGRWSFPAHWPSRYFVWLERADTRAHVTELREIVLDGPGEHGPFDLVPSSGKPFDLLFVNVPPDGALRVLVLQPENEPKSENVACAGSTCAHRIEVQGAAEVTIEWNPGTDHRAAGIRRRVHIDPARDSAREIDLGGDRMREIELVARGATLPSFLTLAFVRLDAPDGLAAEIAQVTLRDGKAASKLALAPGRWLFTCGDPQRTTAIAGIVDVDAAATPLHIERDVVSKDRAELGAGLRLLALDGVDLESYDERLCSLRWTESEGSVLINARSKWTVIR